MKWGVALSVALLLLIGCASEVPEETTKESMKTVSFATDDGVTIIGNYWKGSGNAVLLLHMLPATKESWNEFAEKLNDEGFTVLAIDLRGHGESTNNGTLNYKTFTDAQHQASIKDVEAAVSYLKKQGATNISIAGASIGANLALVYQSEHQEIKKTILLSAGENYRGVVTGPAAEALQEDQKVFFIEGSSDPSSAGTADVLSSALSGDREVMIYNTSAHGTNLFNEHPELMQELITWLKA